MAQKKNFARNSYIFMQTEFQLILSVLVPFFLVVGGEGFFDISVFFFPF